MITLENSFQVDESNVRQLVDAAEASILFSEFLLSLSRQVCFTFTFYAIFSTFTFYTSLFHFHFLCLSFSLSLSRPFSLSLYM